MPKMKTKSAAKKRFSFTASGKVKSAQAGKRHGMIKRTTKFVRDAGLHPNGGREAETLLGRRLGLHLGHFDLQSLQVRLGMPRWPVAQGIQTGGV